MSWQDRQYNQANYNDGGPQRPMGFQMPRASVVTWLIGINAIVFLLDSTLFGSARANAISPSIWGNFNIEQAIYKLQIWRWVTYQFLHADFFHILVNIIGLYLFGRLIEQYLGSKRFLAFYLLCGVSGAVLMTILAYIPNLLFVGPTTPLVGASGSVFGLIAACAVLFPHQRVMLLFPPIPMSMRTLALVFLGVAALSVISGSNNAGGEAAHLGGAALGFFLIKNPRLLDFADSTVSIKSAKPTKPGNMKAKFNQAAQARNKRVQEDEQKEVDRILEKVKEQGVHSLTAKEQKTLKQATERMNRTG